MEPYRTDVHDRYTTIAPYSTVLKKNRIPISSPEYSEKDVNENSG